MTTIPAPILIVSREEWPDADFDLPEGELIHAPCDKDVDDEDWDLDLNIAPIKPIRHSALAKLAPTVETTSAQASSSSLTQTFILRPPALLPNIIDGEDDDDEGVSTIKVASLPQPIIRNPHTPLEDFEDDFALPSDLTQLSLAPLSLSRRTSKNSLEWGDKDQTSSSQSSDAYSSLGFADASPSSNSTSSVSLPDTETEEDEGNDDLEGLVLPSALFESGQGARQLTKILEIKMKAQPVNNQVKIASPDPDDDFEAGLVIDDDVDLSPSRLLNKTQQPQRPSSNRSSTLAKRPSSLRPPSRANRAKSPLNPPISSTRQLQKIRLSPSPPLLPPTPSQSFQAFSSGSLNPPPSSMSFLSPKPGSLRGQKSYSGLKPPTPPSTLRTLSRKASLSSLIEANQSQASGSGSSTAASTSKARYEEPTAASRAKSHKYSTSRVQELKVPPTRPSTPSSNPAALRLTMPTQSRLKARPALSGVFNTATLSNIPSPATRTTSPFPPLPPRPPSAASKSNGAPTNSPPAAPKLLRRPKRQRTFGDGSELDGIEDLPTDRDKEGKFRVQPKGYGNRIPGATYSSKSIDKETVRKKGRREGLCSKIEPPPLNALNSTTNTLKRTTTRIEFPSKQSSPKASNTKKIAITTPSPQARRKPTLIRNLGGNNGPKVIGEMKWNPLTLRWEGNDHVLRDFDAVVGTSTRPALITHLTGSSIGSPVGSFASGARIVGNMIFDPTRMCWISTLPPDEDEPDIFANMADDEEDGDTWETKGGTIRASLQPSSSDVSCANTTATNSSSDITTSSKRAEAPSPAGSHTRTISESGSERGSRASMVFVIDETFVENCRLAEERHRVEMKGWRSALAAQDTSLPDRSHLYEIRALATRKY